VKVNGTPISFLASKRWKDPHIRAVSIEKAAKAGANTITIAAHPFDVRMELENVYLSGNFKVEAEDRGFRLAAPAPLRLGSWAAQGYPFYASAMRYETEVSTSKGTLRVDLGDWQGSVAEILVDGKRAGVLGWQPWRAEVPVSAGRHTVAVRVVSTPRNLFGPFHNRTKPRMRAWPAAWADFPEHQPAGAQYDVLDYGLMGLPTLSIGKDLRDQRAQR
jgi:hypothetical protein